MIAIARIHRRNLRAAAFLAAVVDRFPRLTSAALWVLSLWFIWHVFMTYPL